MSAQLSAGVERIQVNRFSFRRKGSHRNKDKDKEKEDTYDYTQMTYLR